MASIEPKPPAQGLMVVRCTLNELSDHIDSKWLDANREIFGRFKSDGDYMIVYHNGVMVRAEPLHHKDMINMVEQAYLLGYWDGHGQCLSKPHVDPIPVKRVRA